MGGKGEEEERERKRRGIGRENILICIISPIACEPSSSVPITWKCIIAESDRSSSVDKT